MPLCGFNEQMLEGLRQFHLGLVEHGILERSERKGQTVAETVERELQDMEAFREGLPEMTDPLARDLIKALINYSDAFYRIVDGREIEDYHGTLEAIGRLYFEMDRKYYSELEGKPDRMGQLVRYLNEVNDGVKR